jgi:hypothetical protein
VAVGDRTAGAKIVPGHRQSLLEDANKLVKELQDMRESIDGYAAELKMLTFGPQRCAIKSEERVLEQMSEMRDSITVQCRGTMRATDAFRINFDDSLMASV